METRWNQTKNADFRYFGGDIKSLMAINESLNSLIAQARKVQSEDVIRAKFKEVMKTWYRNLPMQVPDVAILGMIKNFMIDNQGKFVPYENFIGAIEQYIITISDDSDLNTIAQTGIWIFDQSSAILAVAARAQTARMSASAPATRYAPASTTHPNSINFSPRITNPPQRKSREDWMADPCPYGEKCRGLGIRGQCSKYHNIDKNLYAELRDKNIKRYKAERAPLQDAPHKKSKPWPKKKHISDDVTKLS